jgi:hypothetical protein
MVIRSYRKVFDIERRIYRIDRLRLNPGGVPVRGVVYFVVILIGALVAGRLPFLGTMASLAPWYLRVIAAPALIAALLSVIRIEGRPFHLGARALWRCWVGSRWWARTGPARRPGSRWHPAELVLLPDGSDSRMRRLRYTGPGAVRVSLAHERVGTAIQSGSVGIGRGGRRPALVLRPVPGAEALRDGQVIALSEGVRLLVRPRSEGPPIAP